jgi:hypothetical protein
MFATILQIVLNIGIYPVHDPALEGGVQGGWPPFNKMRTILSQVTRNSQPFLGKAVNEKEKSRVPYCWTPKGEPTGGTR